MYRKCARVGEGALACLFSIRLLLHNRRCFSEKLSIRFDEILPKPPFALVVPSWLWSNMDD